MEEPLPTTVAPIPAAPAQADWSQVTAPPLVPASTGTFDVGQFLSRTFRIWLRGAPLLVPIGFVTAAPLAVGMYLFYSRLDGLTRGQVEEVPAFLVGVGAVWLLSVLFLLLQMGMVVRGALGRLAGERIGLGGMLGGGFRSLPAVLGIGVLAGLALIPAALALLVPAFVLMTAWCAAVPVAVSERVGPVRALSRSWELTRGHRWRIFLGFAVLTIAVAIVNSVAQGIVTAAMLAVTNPGVRAADPTGVMAVPMAVSQLIGGVLGTVSHVGAAVAYRGLRDTAEGGDPTVLARVFE